MQHIVCDTASKINILNTRLGLVYSCDSVPCSLLCMHSLGADTAGPGLMYMYLIFATVPDIHAKIQGLEPFRLPCG
jgi:hypothetical protein